METITRGSRSRLGFVLVDGRLPSLDNSWAPRKTKWGIVKKIGYLGFMEKKCSISKIRKILMIPPKK